MMIRYVVVCITFYLVSHAAAYGTGAPNEVCDSMTPLHNATAQTSESPYKIYLSGDKEGGYVYVVNNGKIDITLKNEGISDGVEGFEGFLCTAEQGRQVRVGSFTSERKDLVREACEEKDGITHSTSTHIDELVISFHAPDKGFTSDRVEIWCTFVEHKATFWKWVKGDFAIRVAVSKPADACSEASYTGGQSPLLLVLMMSALLTQ